MGGTISVQSIPAEGSIFSIAVPFNKFHYDASTVTAQLLPVSEEQLPSGLRILVAEDNAVNRKLVLRILERAGHLVTLASNGIEALRLHEEGNFDVILMDIQMPEMDGEKATKLIRNGAINPEVPIVAVTANALTADKDRYLSLGMTDYVAKPIDPKELFRVLSRVARKVPADQLSAQ